MLTDKLVDSFKGVVEVIAWILLLIGTILGGIIGYQSGYMLRIPSGLGAFLGVIIFLTITLIIETIIFPPAIILFKIHSLLKKEFILRGAGNYSEEYNHQQKPVQTTSQTTMETQG